MIRHLDSRPETDSFKNGVTTYADRKNDINWYEIDGIKIEKHSIERINGILYRLIHETKVSIVLYCLYSKTGKIEVIERDFIVELKRDFPQIKVLAVITECVNDDTAAEFARTIQLSTKQTKVIAVLAKELKTKAGYLEPFGLEELASELR